MNVKSAIIKQDIIHDATLQKDQTATKKANQERWSRIKNEYEQRDCNQRNAEGMTGVTAEMHMYMAWKSGSMKQEPVNMTYKRIRYGHSSFKSTISKQDKMEEITEGGLKKTGV